jgi:exoribonuclease-2
MVVAADGSVTSSDVYRGLVKNRAKLAYRGVAAWLDGGAAPPEKVAKTEGLADQLRTQDRVALAMRAVRHQHGALDLETIEPETVVRNGAIVDVRADRPNRAKRLIEDFMIAANGVVARFLEGRKRPTLLRVIRTPERWDRIRQVAKGFNVILPEAPDPVALSRFLTGRREADPLHFPDLSLAVVKLLGAGEYVVQTPGGDAGGHFGLAVREYSHSTAPNRRFPDLVTQRLLKAALADRPAPYTAAELAALAAHCTEREDAAKKVERQVRKSAAALFLSTRVGETFDALVTGASEKGTWVRVLRPPVEGRLMDADGRINVGDPIRVRLQRLDVERGFIDFVRARS